MDLEERVTLLETAHELRARGWAVPDAGKLHTWTKGYGTQAETDWVLATLAYDEGAWHYSVKVGAFVLTRGAAQTLLTAANACDHVAEQYRSRWSS